MTFFRRCCLVLASVLAATGLAHGVAVSERSPVRLGLWWDPSASGSGFELFAAGGEQVLVWYTYREDGRPVWYTASGRFDAEGRWSAPLQQHRWVDGRRESRSAGRVTLRRDHFEAMALEFEVGSRGGTQALVPFPVSGIVPEVDHSGAFYDPRVSGYGVGLTEQGDTVIAGLYFYDAQGEATWRVGDNGGRGDEFAMRGFRGACPGCTVVAPTPVDTGQMTLVRHEETRVTAKYRGAGGATWPLDGELRQLSTPASARPADRQLASFDNLDAVRAYVEGAVLGMPPPSPMIDFSPPPQMDSYSSTNTQEAGVDEADTVDTDGRFIYSFAPRDGSRAKLLRIGESIDGATLQMHTDRPLASLADGPQQAGMYVHGNHLAVVAGTAPSYYAGASLWTEFWSWTGGTTKLELLDRSNPRVPVSRMVIEFDSHLVSSRRIGDRLYLVMRKSVDIPGLHYWADPAEDLANNRIAVSQVPTADMLPRVRVATGESRPLVTPDKIYLPVSGALPPSPEFFTVVGIDLASPQNLEAVAVAGSVGAVYASPTRLYVATTRNEQNFHPLTGSTGPGLAVTDIHEFELGASGPKVAATGTVEGFLDRDIDRAAFRFSEKDGRLRVVTVASHWGALGQNRLTVLERSTVSPGMLKTLSYLPSRDRPEPIGKPFEQLYGTRYVGDKLYAVTFQRVDPLYVIDLSDPAHPRIEGAVELPGYSDYLHPVGEDLLVGIGHDAIEIPGWAGPAALLQGVQFNLFDVSDPSHPVVLQQESIGKRGTGTAVSSSHHALSVLHRAGGVSLALPLRVHEDQPGSPPPTSPFNYVPWSWSGLQRIEVVGTTPNDARLVVGQKLVTHSRTTGNDPGYDDALFGARSVQFTRGTVYVENGRYWLGGQEGALLAGPL